MGTPHRRNLDRVVNMIAMWIVLSLAVAAMVGWRLRKATGTFDRIMRDDGVPEAASEAESLPTSHDR
jgi:hypothetical protein